MRTARSSYKLVRICLLLDLSNSTTKSLNKHSVELTKKSRLSMVTKYQKFKRTLQLKWLVNPQANLWSRKRRRKMSYLAKSLKPLKRRKRNHQRKKRKTGDRGPF